MFIHVGLTFRVLFEKRSKDDKNNDIKNEWKHMRDRNFDPYFLALMTLHMN
jgi:hypothetical protein